MKPKYKIGQALKIAKDNDNENYDKYRDMVLKVHSIATSKEEHPGFDDGVGEPLYDLTMGSALFAPMPDPILPFSLYEYELEEA